jgi:thiol-disulfide isomerase/thioredoxin
LCTRWSITIKNEQAMIRNLLNTGLLLFVLLLSCGKPTPKRFRIEGQISPLMNDQAITLSVIYPHPSPRETEQPKSTIIRNGRFAFDLHAEGLEIYALSMNHADTRVSAIFSLLPKNTAIVFRDTLLRNYVVHGNEIDKLYSKIREDIRNIQGPSTNYLLNWIKHNMKSPLSSQYLFGIKDHISDAELASIYSRMPESVKLNSWGKELTYAIDSLHVGKYAPEFSQRESNGHLVHLSNYHGKYVLVDFWASWCVSCRAETPGLIQVYRKYHSKGLEIIGVSLDKDRQAWLNAISNDSLPWINVSDLNGWYNQVSFQYRIHSTFKFSLG